MEDDKSKEFLLNRLWEEMKQASCNMYYAEYLIDKQIFNSKIYNCIIASLSFGGAIFSFISLYIPLVANVIVGLLSILNQFHPVMFLKAEDMVKLCSLQTDYILYFHRLQNIYDFLFSDKTSVEVAQADYTHLKEENASRQTEIGKLFGTNYKSLTRKAQIKSDKYLTNIYL